MNADNVYLLHWTQDSYPNDILRRFAESNSINTKQSLYGKLLIQMIVYRRFGIDPENQQYLRGNYGKPYLNNLDGFYFNISHSASVLAIAISNQQIGIDIEQIDCADDGITKHFFSIGEQEFITCVAKGQKNKRFYQIWTAKEAYIKYCGTGLNMSLSSFSVLEEPISNYIESYQWNNEYVFSICKKHRQNTNFSIIDVCWFEKQATCFLNEKAKKWIEDKNYINNVISNPKNIQKLLV